MESIQWIVHWLFYELEIFNIVLTLGKSNRRLIEVFFILDFLFKPEIRPFFFFFKTDGNLPAKHFYLDQFCRLWISVFKLGLRINESTTRREKISKLQKGSEWSASKASNFKMTLFQTWNLRHEGQKNQPKTYLERTCSIMQSELNVIYNKTINCTLGDCCDNEIGLLHKCLS